jgi:4-hydroxybenzoate polyprenyltransferase
MTLITLTLSNSPGVRWSAQLRLNGVWSLWLAYIFGFLCVNKTPPIQHVVFDILFLLVLGIISAIWNDWSDQNVDAANKRKYSWNTLPKRHLKLAVIALTMALIGLSLLNTYRLISLILIVPIGYLYNNSHWSGRPLASLILYSLFYRVMPILLGMAAGDFSGNHLPLILVVLGMAIMRFGTGMYKDIPDQFGDAIHHKQTFVLQYKTPKMANISALLWLIGGGSLILGVSGVRQSSTYLCIILFTVCSLIRLGLFRFRRDTHYQQKHFARAFQAENGLLIGLILFLGFWR